jgi:hypothetical protein
MTDKSVITNSGDFRYYEFIFATRGCIQKFPDWIDNEINNNNNKHSLRSNTKGYSGRTH